MGIDKYSANTYNKYISFRRKKMKNLSAKWQKTIVWLSGWLNIIAFFLAGGYIYLNTDDDDVKRSAKTAVVLTLFFTAIEVLRSIIYNVLNIANVSYDTLSVISDIGTAFSIIKTITFTTLFILDLCGIKFIPVLKNKENKETTEEE